MKHGLWNCAKGQPCSEHTPPPPEPRAWVMIGDLQEQFTGSQGRLAADMHFESSQGRDGGQIPTVTSCLDLALLNGSLHRHFWLKERLAKTRFSLVSLPLHPPSARKLLFDAYPTLIGTIPKAKPPVRARPCLFFKWGPQASHSSTKAFRISWPPNSVCPRCPFRELSEASFATLLRLTDSQAVWFGRLTLFSSGRRAR